jgi:hypothetical protein
MRAFARKQTPAPFRCSPARKKFSAVKLRKLGYRLELRCPTCGTLLGKTFSMIGHQLAENYEQVRLAAVLTAQVCPGGCHRDRDDRAIDAAVEIFRDEEPRA